MTETVVVKDDDRMFVLVKDGHGDCFIKVVCGGIAMYEAKIKLTDQEMDSYNSEGTRYLVPERQMYIMYKRQVMAFQKKEDFPDVRRVYLHKSLLTFM